MSEATRKILCVDDHKDFCELVAAILMRDFEPLPDDIPLELRDVITRALQKRPEYRYPSAARMRDDLHAVLRGKSIAAPISALSCSVQTVGSGLLAKTEPYETQVGHSDRSKTPIEPYLSDQWFVKMAPLAEPAVVWVVVESWGPTAIPPPMNTPPS